MMPFGIAVYPERKMRSTMDRLPNIKLTRTYHESVAGGAEVVHLRTRPTAQPMETRSVRRRQTTVPIDTATDVAYRVLALRTGWSRAALARYIGVSQRQLHLAELGCAQPEAVQHIIRALNTYEIPPIPENPRSRSRGRYRRYDVWD